MTIDPSTSLWQICQNLYFPHRFKIRSPKTKIQYRFAVQDFGRALARPATLADLTDDALCQLVTYLRDRNLAARTINERVGRIKTLWSWLARRGHVPLFCTIERLDEPRRTPRAWTELQLQALFASCALEDLPVGAVPGPIWWTSFHAALWNTAERKSALLAVRWEWLDLEGRTLHVPAEVRKRQTADMVYELWPETIAAIRTLPKIHELTWHWPLHESSFYNRYSRILKRAGLPDDRKSKPHAMRVSHATWVRVRSGQSAQNLGHASESTTRRHYEDPRIARPEVPRLFIPWRQAE